MGYAERVAQELQDRAMPIGETDGLRRIMEEADAEIAALRLLYDGATVRSEVQAEKIAALRARVEALEAGLVEIQHRASCGEDCQVLADLADDLLEEKP